MREPDARYPSFGLIAEFDRPEALVDGVRRARDAGYVRLDAYSPFPLEEVTELLGLRDWRVPWLVLLGGIAGAATGYFMQVWIKLDFPIPIGGRPLIAPQGFMLITFELLVLFAVLFGVIGMLLLNHLPRLHHPIFDVPDFHLASTDKFFLVIFANDDRFDGDRTRRFLETLSPLRVAGIDQTEEPE
jgi:hypothetical protein